MKRYTVKLQILDNGDGFIKLPEEIVDEFHFKDCNQVELVTQKDRITLV